MKFGLLYLLKDEGHPLNKACKLLEASTSGFYDWLKGRSSKRKESDNKLKLKIRDVFEKSDQNYGSPRIHKSLRKNGEAVSENKVAKLMREEGISAQKKKAFRPKTTINNPNTNKSPRVFDGDTSHVTGPNQVWVSDLTYLSTGDGFSYLVTVMDLYNREIKGWDVSDSMDAINTKEALLMALRASPGTLNGLVFHSDQGVQYCSSEVRDKLNFLNIDQSMSRKGNCYDNSFAESFFGSLKREMRVTHFEDLNEAKREVFRYLNWYNQDRLHSSLGHMSPVEYLYENCLAA